MTGVQQGGSLPPVAPGSLAFNAGRTTAVLNNAGDNIYLVDPEAGEFIAAAYGNWPLMDPTDPATWSVRPSGASVASQGTPGAPNICFAAGTRIAVPGGTRPVETLRPGDMLRLADSGQARLHWVGMRRLSFGALRDDPRLWPVEIAAGALGHALPAHPLRLSPQHRVEVQGRIVARIAGEPQGLVAARHLLGLSRVTQPRPSGPVTYVHLMCARHEVILAEDARCETLYLGAIARAALPADALAEILALFPDLARGTEPRPARPILLGAKARRLVARHARNARPLQQAP